MPGSCSGLDRVIESVPDAGLATKSGRIRAWSEMELSQEGRLVSLEKGALMEERIVLTARRGMAKQSQTLSSNDAAMAAEKLRLEGWVVTIGAKPEQRSVQRARKARALVIASHRTARRAQRSADDAAEAKQAVDRARLEIGRASCRERV